MIGHNRGPSMEPGQSWRRYAWTRARADLLPTLPIEVVRLRVKRAQELGLPYKTYAGVRASTGHDIVAFLFSNNALELLREDASIPAERHARLAALHGTHRLALTHRPVTPAEVVASGVIDIAQVAPTLRDSWSAMRDRIARFIVTSGTPRDGILVIGETDFEREWAEAGKTAGFVSGAQFFGGPAPVQS